MAHQMCWRMLANILTIFYYSKREWIRTRRLFFLYLPIKIVVVPILSLSCYKKKYLYGIKARILLCGYYPKNMLICQQKKLLITLFLLIWMVLHNQMFTSRHFYILICLHIHVRTLLHIWRWQRFVNSSAISPSKLCSDVLEFHCSTI